MDKHFDGVLILLSLWYVSSYNIVRFCEFMICIQFDLSQEQKIYNQHCIIYIDFPISQIIK